MQSAVVDITVKADWALKRNQLSVVYSGWKRERPEERRQDGRADGQQGSPLPLRRSSATHHRRRAGQPHRDGNDDGGCTPEHHQLRPRHGLQERLALVPEGLLTVSWLLLHRK